MRKLLWWWDQLSPYRDKRVLSVFVLGVAQGLPWIMIVSMLTLWFKSEGISRANIGYATLVTAVYAINFLWSPVVDLVKLPFFRWLSQKQGWIVSCQLIIVSCCCIMFTLDPAENAKLVVLVALVLAFFSATQDIAIDSYRVDSFDTKEGEKISAAAAMATAGWWTGYAGLGFIPLRLSDLGWAWPQLYLLFAGITALLCLLCTLVPAPRFSNTKAPRDEYSNYHTLTQYMPDNEKYLTLFLLSAPLMIAIYAFVGSPGVPSFIVDHSVYTPAIIFFELGFAVFIALYFANLIKKTEILSSPMYGSNVVLARIMTALVAPLREFFSRSGLRTALMILGFVFLFKLGEAFLGRMSIVFYKEVGFSNTDIGLYSKLLSWWVTISFAMVAGILNAKLGLFKGLFISGCAMAATNLMFSAIYWVGPDINLYIAAILCDGFTQAWSLVAFVSFISLMCNHAFSATQYALLASLGNLGRTTVSSVSGQVVDWLNGNWGIFFILTTLMVIPSLLLLLNMRKEIRAIEYKKKQLD